MVLILIIAVLSILATLIPQDRDPAFYFHSYPLFLARIVTALNFDNFFRSVVFLFPVGLFFLNLSVCTVDRINARFRRKAKRRHGPDLIHIGLLVLIVGAMFTVFARRETVVYLGEGETIGLPGDYTLEVRSFEFQQYGDGRPKDWISTVTVSRDAQTVIASYGIEVNKPLKVGKVKVYQAFFGREDTITMIDAEGEEYRISNGHGLQWEEKVLLFQGLEGTGSPDSKQALFEQWDGQVRTAVFKLGAGEQIAGFRIEGFSSRQVTGLQVVRDPGFLPVVIALIIVAAGLSLTLIQKRRDSEGEKES